MKIILHDNVVRQFVWEVFAFLSKHYSIKLGSDDGRLFRIEDSPFGNRSPFSSVKGNGYLPNQITISGNDYYLSKDWYIDTSGGILCIDNLSDYVRQITKDRYGIKEESGDFIFFESVMCVLTTADNLIRADYTYMRSLTTHLVAMPASHFDLTSTILASTGNVTFLALMDRIPVYVVDSKFMCKYFEEGDTHWKCDIILIKVLHLLERILDIFQGKEDAEKLPDKIKRTRELISILRKCEKYDRFVPVVERFLTSVEEWIEKYGIPSTLKNDNYEPWLKRIIDELRGRLSMPTEALGVYCPEWEKNGFHEKAIFICWERIRECASLGHAIDLLTKVTIHEFCHAYMDIIAGSGRNAIYKDVYHWMEESMANVLTLKIIENYVIKHPSAINLFEYAKKFMLNQPDAYASAVRMWGNGICDYDLWAWNKDKCVVAASVNDWYNQMSASWKTLPDDRIRELWRKVRQEILGIC